MEMVSQIGKCFRVQWGLQEGQTQIKKNRRLVVGADFLSYNMLNEEPFCVAVCQFLQGICLRFGHEFVSGIRSDGLHMSDIAGQ
jgi:hypothetical protein